MRNRLNSGEYLIFIIQQHNSFGQLSSECGFIIFSLTFIISTVSKVSKSGEKKEDLFIVHVLFACTPA